MSAQDTSFEALAASPGDFAIDSEWMGDSPPALTVDFIQNQQNHIHHIHQLERIQQQQQQQQQGSSLHGFESAAAVGGPGVGKSLTGKNQLLVDDPSLSLSHPPPIASSPDSLLSSFQDSSSDISSKQTSMSAISSYVGGTSVKTSRSRPKGSMRSVTEASSAGTLPKQQHQHRLAQPDDVMMTDGSLNAIDGDNASQNWSFRDYLQDDEQEHDEDGTTKTESDILGTIDPKSIEHNSGFSGAEGSIHINAANLPDLSPYSGGPSPLDFVSATSSPTPDDITIPNFSTAQLFSGSAAGFTNPIQGASGHQARRGHSKAASQYSLSQSMNDLKTNASREVSPVSNFVFGQGPSPQAYMQASQSPIDTNDFRAMLNEGNRRRALDRAAAATHAPRAAPVEGENSDDNDDCRPANGGEIWICKGCIQRERKRANRKKSKKPEDDEEWSREEHRRIIIFNTNEVKDWQRPTPNANFAQSENASIVVPMRITCYCRHHGEKTGFQVIFTLKDYRGQVIAQSVSRSIMITDDHKTPTAPSAGSVSAAASIADGDGSAGDAQDPAKSSATTTPVSAAKGAAMKASKHGMSPNGGPSVSDLPGLKRSSVTFSTPQPSERTSNNLNGGASQVSVASAAETARAHSRPASPDGLKGHFAKKRKSSAGVPKVPTGLSMTRMETSPQQPTPQSLPNAAHRHATSASPVAQFPNNNNINNANGTSFLSPPAGFVPDSMSAAVDMALMAGGSGDPDIDSLAGMVPMNTDAMVGGPLTPNSHSDQGNVFANTNSNNNNSNGNGNSNGNRSGSFDNLALSQTSMFSAPTSAHPSRAPSPNGIRNSMQMFQQQLFQQQQQQLQQQLNQAQFSQPFPANLFTLPMSLSQAATTQTSQPVIHKVIPSEGPKSGGIEVTILGGAFYQGLDVMFGDQRATTTTFWGESSLVCLVPPSRISGHVPVTLRQSNQRGQPFTAPTQQRITFKYLDDDEQQLLRAALTVLSRKMTGKIEDAQDVARRIIGSETSNWGTGGSNSGGSSTGSTRSVAGNVANLTASGAGTNPNFETHLLKVLELIDLDDSSNQTRLNMQRRTTGHSMLHLACVLGMHRFVAGLLARGANPDVRDNGGYTPLHLAALNNQPEIVRRLIHAGADPTMRTLSGLTASEVAASREVLRSIKKFERHNRSRSGGSLHSRTSSAASLRSLWEPMTMTAVHRRSSGAGVDESEETGDSENSSRAEVDSSSYAASGDDEGTSGEQDEEGDEDWLDMRSGSHILSRSSRGMPNARRSAARDMSPSTRPLHVVAVAGANGADVPAGLASPAAAAVTAFRDHLSAHFQQLVAQIPQIPNNPLPDYYQAYLNSGAFQRISSLVPNINIGNAMGSRPNSSGDNSGNTKDLEGRWWDLSSLMATGAAPPPAYEEIFPQKHKSSTSSDLDVKQATAAAAAAEAEADTKCAALYDTHTQQAPAQVERDFAEAVADGLVVADHEGEHAAASTTVLQIGRKHQITKEQQDNFRRVHQEKRKGLGSDTFLYTVWIPILLSVLLLWLSGARAWDFFPSVTFNVPYATSLGNPIRPTSTGSTANKGSMPGSEAKQVLPPAPAVAAIPNAAGPDDIIAAVEGIVA
ncbi:ankyrin repeat protein [Ophiostoma piceae UAMH 11346]|uniref:Ankyrin repeat protein n=1 Tax=Ophiostoma piceae (strain UAMH 11346) TaxID=1262450 RepID=S3CQD6_OPHP1|nr:ankyrin repeat protein [Ophiostoma piceae UAMH 11346]